MHVTTYLGQGHTGMSMLGQWGWGRQALQELLVNVREHLHLSKFPVVQLFLAQEISASNTLGELWASQRTVLRKFFVNNDCTIDKVSPNLEQIGHGFDIGYFVVLFYMSQYHDGSCYLK